MRFLVAGVRGEVVGYAYATRWRDKLAYRHMVENTIYLAPEWTGKDLGRRLLDWLLAKCTRAGICQVIVLIADIGDPASAALHYPCGFLDTGRLEAVDYKHGHWVDTLLLQRVHTTMEPHR